MRHAAAALLTAVQLLLLTPTSAVDFVYADFSDTSGLRLNGHAATSSCGRPGEYAYSVLHGANDAAAPAEAPILTESTATLAEASTLTLEEADPSITSRFLATFPHREVQSLSPAGCDVRLRLTPSRPDSVSSVMRLEAAPVLTGFETGFTFQVSDHSRSCTLVKDRAFSVRSYQSCSVHGGDGFAFVVHNAPAGSRLVAESGGGMGYDGLRNAIVVEFDSWYNAAPEVLDLLADHVSVQAAPPHGGFVSMGEDTRLGQARAVPLADGLIHAVRIVYSADIRYDLLPYFTGSSVMLQYLRDNGEDRRLGTLAVYVDNMTAPLLAVPVNLNAVLDLPEDQAFVGFTSSTGAAWEKHDILSWYFCETEGCPNSTRTEYYSHPPPLVVAGAVSTP